MVFADRLVRLDEAAEQIAIPVGTLRSARKQGRLLLPIVKVGPRVLAVRQSDIDAVVAGQKPVMEERKAAAKRRFTHEGE